MAGSAFRKKLIHWCASPSNLIHVRDNASDIQRTGHVDLPSPFDGLVVHSIDCMFRTAYSGVEYRDFTEWSWGRRHFSEADLEPAFNAFADLAKGAFTRFTDNFVRFTTRFDIHGEQPIDWTDALQFREVENNARLTAKLAAVGKFKGVLFDPEPYDWPDNSMWRVEAARWTEYSQHARQRGRSLMRAFQSEYPGLTVYLAFGTTSPWWRASTGAGEPTTPADWRQTKYGLLVPFVHGMIDCSRQGRDCSGLDPTVKARLVDGMEEPTYDELRNQEDFDKWHVALKSDVLAMMPQSDFELRRKYLQAISAGFLIPMEARVGDLSVPQGLAVFETMLRSALIAADDYVAVWAKDYKWWSSEPDDPLLVSRQIIEAFHRARQSADG